MLNYQRIQIFTSRYGSVGIRYVVDSIGLEAGGLEPNSAPEGFS